MPRRSKKDKISPDIFKDMLHKPLNKEFQSPETLYEALLLAESLIEEVNGYLSTSPLVQDYASLFASRMGKEKGSFSVVFDPTVQFESSGRNIKALSSLPAKNNSTKTSRKKSAKPSINEELENLTQKAKKMNLDISDIAQDSKAIRDRISLMEDMQVDSPSQEEEIIVIHPTKKRKKKVRVMGISSESPSQRSLGGVRGLLDNIKDVSLDAVADSVSQKNGIREDGK